MFIKLVVLILVCGSSGVGLLSVRQSRLQAAHEMAEARHRTLVLEEIVGELRASIAQISTPDRVAELLESFDGYAPAVHQRATLVNPNAILELQSRDQSDAPTSDQTHWIDRPVRDEHAWTLSDGSRVIVIDD